MNLKHRLQTIALPKRFRRNAVRFFDRCTFVSLALFLSLMVFFNFGLNYSTHYHLIPLVSLMLIFHGLTLIFSLRNKESTFHGFFTLILFLPFDLGYGIVSSVREYSYEEGDVLICGLGHPEVKRAICEPLLKAGANFLTIIHPTAKVGRGCSIGVGCVICPYATLTCDIQLGDFVLFNVMSTAGHDVQVGDWSTLSAHSDCTGGVELSKSVFLGSGAPIIPNKKVGRSATVGAGAVVTRDVPSEDTVFGNPARSIN